MLKSIRVGNFKAFAETQEIPLKPITLIFGPNSSGKSSVLHSLALAHEAERTGNIDVVRTQLGGSAIDLGGFRQYVHRREANRRVEWGATLDVRFFQGRIAELCEGTQSISMNLFIGVPLDDEDEPVAGEPPRVMSCEVLADGQMIMRMSRRPDATLALDTMQYDSPIIHAVIELLLRRWMAKSSEKDVQGLINKLPDAVAGIRIAPGQFLPGEIEGGELCWEKFHSYNWTDLWFPALRHRRDKKSLDMMKYLLPGVLTEFLTGLTETIRTDLRRLQYLGPLRSSPPRHLAFFETDDNNWFAGGGHAWSVVRENADVREKVNTWLGSSERLKTQYKLLVQRLVPPGALDSDVAIYDAIQDIYEELSIPDEKVDPQDVEGLDKLPDELMDEDTPLNRWDPELFARIVKRRLLDEGRVDGVNELVLMDMGTGTMVSHRDVGIGISQVLPVLVAAYGSEKQIIVIEQPEIHLHPRLQAELGDVFIESALGERKNTLILETHSEHLILRILRRVRETTKGDLEPGLTPITPADISVLYVEPGKEGSKVITLSVTDDGDFLEAWPEGFFEERYEELFGK